MQPLRVWAPFAKKVEMRVGGEPHSMSKDPDGWWSAADISAHPGVDYGFILDGKGPFPDPRSPWQPDGVEGISRIVDHNKFEWTDAAWRPPPLSSAVIYELHVGTFTPAGTFEAAIGKLDHLVALGVTHVELMPVNEFPGARGWGYDGVNLFAPHHAYGGPAGLKKLVDACHARGLAALLDVVYNHFGPTGNHLDKFGPYMSERHSSVWGRGLNFDDAGSAEVRRLICDNALMWLRDYHFDGLRLDAVHAIADFSAAHILEQLESEVKQLEAQLGRRLALIPESDLNDPRILWSRERGGFGLDAQWSDDFHHALHSLLTGEKNGYYADFGRLADLDKALRQAFVYDGRYSRHRRRCHGRPAAGLSGDRFVACMQNHDQVGNRAKGERSSQLMSAGRLKIAAAMVLTSPYIPLLFQGEEWGASTPFQFFTDHKDPKLGRAVREGRRKEFAAFGWQPEEIPDPQALETFMHSKLDWAELSSPPHAEMLEWHRRLIALRKSEPVLMDGRMARIRTEYDASGTWFVMIRGPIIVAFNIGVEAKPVVLPEGKHRVLMSSFREAKLEDGRLMLSPDSVVILQAALPLL